MINSTKKYFLLNYFLWCKIILSLDSHKKAVKCLYYITKKISMLILYINALRKSTKHDKIQ